MINGLLRVLILTGSSDLPSHDWQTTTPVLQELLKECCTMQVSANPRALPPLHQFDVLLLHYNGPRWGAASEKAVEEFVRNGGGLVALHGISYGPLTGFEQAKPGWRPTAEGPWPAYAPLIGCVWKTENIGHARRGPFTVRWILRDHPIARGLPESFAADDELYHRITLSPDAQVVAVAWSDPKVGGTGREEPQIWTTAFGSGRTVHLTLGHDAKALRLMRDPLVRALRWAGTR
jgi:hypothetical protein